MNSHSDIIVKMDAKKRACSCDEAQATAAKDVAEQLVEMIKGQPARQQRPVCLLRGADILTPYLKISRILGKLASQLAEGTRTVKRSPR